MLTHSSATSERTHRELVASGKLLRAVDFKSGDLVVLPGPVNHKVKHCVEQETAGLRVSIVLRHVNANFVCPGENYYIMNGKRVDVAADAWVHRQPALMRYLASPLLEESSCSLEA